MGRLSSKVFSFTLASFPLRYITENFLQLWVTLMLEINLLIGNFTSQYYKRDLLSKPGLISLVSISGVLILIHLIGVLALVFTALKQIKLDRLNKTQSSKLLTFVKGLSMKKRIFGSLYFVHYIGLRLTIAVLILISPFVKSFLLWAFIVFIQFVSFCIHFTRIYEKLINYLLVLIRELQLLFVSTYLFSMHFTTQTSEELKLKYLEPFVWTFTAFTLLFTLINLINFIIMFLKLMVVLCNKVKRPSRTVMP